MADGRELLERLCGSTRYRHLYPHGPNVALLLEAYQELDRKRLVGRAGSTPRRQLRTFRGILRQLVRRDVLDRNQRLSYGYPEPRRHRLPPPPPVVLRALSRVDADARALMAAHLGVSDMMIDAGADTTIEGPAHRGLRQLREALLNEALADPNAIATLHPQYLQLLVSAQPRRKAHPIASLLLVKLPLQFLLLLLTLFNLAYIGAYYFFNDEVLGRFVSTRVSGLLDGDLEMKSIHWEGRLIFDLLTGTPTRTVVTDVTVWEPYKSTGGRRRGKAAHAERVEASLVLHEIIPWNRIGIPPVFEIPWVLHFTDVRVQSPMWLGVREYEVDDGHGDVERVIGLRDAFRLYDFDSGDHKGLSFAVDDAVLDDLVLDIDFTEIAQWRTALALRDTAFRLRFDAPDPGTAKPIKLPLHFTVEGRAPRGVLQIDDVEIPLAQVEIERFSSGYDDTPVSEIAFVGRAEAAGSTVHVHGVLHDALTRTVDPALEPLRFDAEASYGELTTVDLEAASPDIGALARHVVAELELPEGTVVARRAPATARIRGPLSDPTYTLAAQGLTLDMLGEPAWGADDVAVSVTIAHESVPERWRDRFEGDAVRRVAVFDTFRGSALDGSFRLRPMSGPATVVFPEPGEPWLIAAELELSGVDPGKLLPGDPDAAASLRGTARGAVDVRKLVIGPRPPGPQLPAPGIESGETELLLAEIDLDDVRLERDRGPKDDRLPRYMRLDGGLRVDEDGNIEVQDVLVATDGARLRMDGGLREGLEALDSFLVDLRIDDGAALAKAMDIPAYFDRARGHMTLFGPLRAPSGSKGGFSIAGVGGDGGSTDASIWMDRGTLHIRAPSARLFGGTGSVEVDATIIERGAFTDDPKVRVVLDLQDVELSRLVGDEIGGRIDLEAEIGDGNGGPARLSEIRAHGLATADVLTVAGTTYRDATLAFRLTREELSIERLVLPLHRSVSPAHAPDFTVPVGEIVAEGTIGLEDDPELDLVVMADNLPFDVVTRLLELELPMQGLLARGTKLSVQGRVSRPKVDGTVAMHGVSASGIALGSGQLEVTSEDFPSMGPLAEHREVRARGELSTLGNRHHQGRDLQWSVDAVVAIGAARKGGTPAVAAQLDVEFDRLALASLMADPLEVEDHNPIQGILQGVSAHVLTCNRGAPMLSDCIDGGPHEAQTLAVKLRVDDAWLSGSGSKTPGDCTSATTLCSDNALSATLEWPMLELEEPWVLVTGGKSPARLELSGAYDLSTPPRTAAVETAAACVPPRLPRTPKDVTGPDVSGGSRGKIHGTIDLAALEPVLRELGIDKASGKIALDLGVFGHAMDPRIRGGARIVEGDRVLLDTEAFPLAFEFTRLDLGLLDGWVAAAGELRLGGESIRFGSVGSDHTAYALNGPCTGRFGFAAEGTVGARVLSAVVGEALEGASGGMDLQRLVVRGDVADGVRLDAVEGTVAFDAHTLALKFDEGITDVTLDRGKIDFRRCEGGDCGGSAPPGWIGVFIGGEQAVETGGRPSARLHARVGPRGEAAAWGRAFVSPDFQQIQDARVNLVLVDVPYRDFDPSGTPVFEAELSSDNLSFRGGSPLVMTGDLSADRTRYVKDAIEGVDILRLTDAVDIPEAPPPEIVRTLQFDLRVKTDRPIRVENNIAHGVEAALTVDVAGNYDHPEFTGRIDVEPGGSVDIPFLTGTYEIQRGRVTLVREIDDAEVDVLALRREPIYIDNQPRQIQLLLGGTLSAITWSCLAEGDSSGALDTVRGCTEYLVLGAGDVQVSDTDVQRFGGGGLANARKPLQVVGHLTELDLGERAAEAAPRARAYVPDMRLRLGQIGPELEIGTPTDWLDFNYGRASLGWHYTRGYPGFLLRQSRELTLRLDLLDPIGIEYSRRSRSYLNERIIFDPLEQRTLELHFDFEIPSLR